MQNINVCRDEPAFKDLHYLVDASSEVRITFEAAGRVKSKTSTSNMLVTIALSKAFMMSAAKLFSFSPHFDVTRMRRKFGTRAEHVLRHVGHALPGDQRDVSYSRDEELHLIGRGNRR